MARLRTAPARWGALVVALGLALLAAAVLGRPPAAAQDPGSLRTQIERSKGREAQLSSAIFATEDAREGPAAFAEKRPPRWQGK